MSDRGYKISDGGFVLGKNNIYVKKICTHALTKIQVFWVVIINLITFWSHTIFQYFSTLYFFLVFKINVSLFQAIFQKISTNILRSCVISQEGQGFYLSPFFSNLRQWPISQEVNELKNLPLIIKLFEIDTLICEPSKIIMNVR